MKNKNNIVLIDNRKEHLALLKEVLEKDFNISEISCEGNKLTEETIIVFDEFIRTDTKFIVSIDFWLTQDEETQKIKNGKSGLDLAFELYKKYSADYGKAFVIFLMTAYDLDYLRKTIIYTDARFNALKIPLENHIELDSDTINLPFYLIRKPITNDKIFDYDSQELYLNTLEKFNCKSKDSYSLTENMKTFFKARLEELKKRG